MYEIGKDSKHSELKWQNDKNVKNLTFGTVNLGGEGKGYEWSIKSAFMTEVSLYI